MKRCAPAIDSPEMESGAEIKKILEHEMKNVLCAFGLQSQLLREYLKNGHSEDLVRYITEISLKNETQIQRMDALIERLNQLL